MYFIFLIKINSKSNFKKNDPKSSYVFQMLAIIIAIFSFKQNIKTYYGIVNREIKSKQGSTTPQVYTYLLQNSDLRNVLKINKKTINDMKKEKKAKNKKHTHTLNHLLGITHLWLVF